VTYLVTFEMDGAGVEYSPIEPIHLDGLLSWCMVEKSPYYVPERDGKPTELDLPLTKYHTQSGWCWQASALSPEMWLAETTRNMRRKFDEGLSTLTTGKPNLIGLRYKDRNDPHVFQLVTRLKGYINTDEYDLVFRSLSRLKYIGRGASRGNGRITRMHVEPCDEDHTLFDRGIATRYIPHPKGWKLVRPRPEYWRTAGQTLCFAPGDYIGDYFDDMEDFNSRQT